MISILIFANIAIPTPYSSNMSPPDYDLFQKLKELLGGVHFSDLTVLNNVVSRRCIHELNFGKLLNGIQRLPKCWHHVTESQRVIWNGCK